MSAVGYEIRDQKEPVAGASESDVLEEQRSRTKSSRWCHGLVERISNGHAVNGAGVDGERRRKSQAL